MYRSAVLSVFAWLCLSLAVFAQNKPPATGFDQQKMMEQMQQQMLAQFDADKNGVLSDQEKMMAQEAMRRQGINMGMPPGGFPGADQFAKQFDRDGDGKLNPQEAAMAQAAYQRMRNNGSGMRGGIGGGGGGGSAMPPQQPVAPPNANDGKSNKVPPLIKRFDKDGDGKLNAEEKAAAQAELKKDKSKDKDAKPKDAKTKEAEAKKDK